MAQGKLILICQSGGEFVKKKDGSLSYTGGEAHAVDIDHDTRFDDLKLELADMWNCDMETMSVKYFIPSNKRTLITVSNDKDLQRMIDFHGDLVTADVYVVARESAAHDSSNMPTNRASRTIVADSDHQAAATTPIAAAAPVLDAAPLATAVSAAATVVTDTTTAPPPAATPSPTTTAVTPTPAIPGADPAATTASSSIAVADTTTPTTTPSPNRVAATSAAATTAPVHGAIADDVGKQRRTASWKIGTNGFTIVSIADDVGQQRLTESWNNDINSPTTTAVGDDVEEQRCTASWENDANSPTTVAVGDDVGQQRLVESWRNGITGVGQQFSSVHEFRDALRRYAIANHFVYKFKKNDGNRVSAKCRSDGCSWRIHASWVPAARSFRIKKMNKSHTCGDICTSAHPQATKHWLASILRDKLRDSPHYKPKEIVSDICRDFGIELNYSQAWRGMEMAREQLQGSYKEAYNQLPWFCERVVETNPGSVARFTTKDALSFQRLFISFHASLHGFQNGCRPLLFLDSTSLKSKYQEILLVAAAVDGDDGIFPVAFAIADVEDDDNWHWFLEQLKSVVSTSGSITFVSDREKGLRKSVQEVFENAHHGYCIRHLVENFKKNLKGPFHGDGKGSLAGNFLAAAQALRLDGFRKCTESIKSVSSEAYNWVMESEPEYWSNAQFKGERYNQITLDIVESFDNWIAEVRELPITQKIDAIRCKMMELIHTRRVDSSNWPTKLTPSKEEKLQEEALKAHSLKVLFSSDSTFEVHDDSINVVNIDQRECSCLGWKITGLPCCHAIAVFNCTGRSPYDYCSRYFTTETFQLTYSESINAVPDIGKPVNRESSDKVQVHPPRPCTSHPPSQPKRKRTKAQEVLKRSLHCSRCKGAGHNRATCKAME